MPLKVVVILVVLVAVVSAAVAVLVHSARIRRKVNYMLDALEDNETNFRFSEDKFIGGRFNKTLNRINGIFKKETRTINEQEKFFGSLLDNVETGVLVFDSSTGLVSYNNNRALQLLGLASLMNIKQLKQIDTSLAEAFLSEESSAAEKRRVELYDEKGGKTLMLSKTSATVQGRSVEIVSFSDVTQEVESSVEDAYSKLLRVLTHEIMNTVTPIASLSDALVSYLEPSSPYPSTSQPPASSLNPVLNSAPLDREETLKALREGLDTIAASSKSLIRFVESYRSISRIAAPVKSVFYVRELFKDVLSLMQTRLKDNAAEMTFAERSEDVILFADCGQIQQIMINLVKNAVQAGAHHICVEARIDSADSTIIDISNDGQPIKPEAQAQIFVPFYTTKQDGSGIGLAISRQIMRMHNGQINLKSSTAEKTTFSLIFR